MGDPIIMRLMADLHIHSRFSIATSPKLTAPSLDRWARIKGIDLVGTGDCTHPEWLSELAGALEPAEDGFFRLKDRVREAYDAGEALAEELPNPTAERSVRFVLSGEISTIYGRDGRTRKVHHLVLLPDFRAAAAFQSRLERLCNIGSDGRPILGIDSRRLFQELLEADDRAILVPAHIWTPWFSALGARSGFDSIDECYGDLAGRIGAVETGLSSNPPMNWAVSSLDRFAIISNSDAHSPEKLGREATLIDIEPGFAGLTAALSGMDGGKAGNVQGGARGSVLGTVEFYPQEGKYHYDGHRACGTCLSPEESGKLGGICPICGKPLTPGVMRRVRELADRPVDETENCGEGGTSGNHRPYKSLVPLPELLGELLESGSGSKKVRAAYSALIAKAGSEFGILLDMDESKIEKLGSGSLSGELLAEAVGRMRSGEVRIQPGYDGEYGAIRVFALGERFEAAEAGLFPETKAAAPGKAVPRPHGKGPGPSRVAAKGPPSSRAERPAEATSLSPQAGGPSQSAAPFSPSPAQEAALNHSGGPALVLAGPGSGKTALLAERIARLIRGGLEPSSILAITFTNKAAEELRTRIARAAGAEKAKGVEAATFHAFCLSLLREFADSAGLAAGFRVLDEKERATFVEHAAQEILSGGRRASGRSGAGRLAAYIESRKRFALLPGDKTLGLGSAAPSDLAELADSLGFPPFDEDLDSAYARYRADLSAAHALDFDDLPAGALRLLSSRPAALAACRTRHRAVFVDEYQDVNFAQYALLRLLGPAELFVIGDPNQAIYAFRGSDRRFMERFAMDYPSAKTYRLSRSFRCAPAIIGAAGRLVGEDLEGTGQAISLSREEFPSDKSEAEGIARAIERLVGGTGFFAMDSGVVDSASPGDAGVGLGQIAILIRTSALAAPLEKALADHGLPYRLVGEKPWWEEEPARSILDALRAAFSKRGLAAAPPAEALRAVALTLVRSPARAVDGEADEALERLGRKAALFPDVESFLDALALGSPQDALDSGADRVALMTIHASKGLEFDHVFVAGLEDGILPFTLFEDEDAERIDEERRILYVAMTRARVGLHLSWTRSRVLRGRPLSLPPSRFLATIEDLVPFVQSDARARPLDRQKELF